MPQSVPSVQFTNDPLLPLPGHLDALEMPIQIVPGVTYLAGQLLGQLAGSANDVQTFTATGTPTGGSFTFIVTNILNGSANNLVIPFNCSSATLQTLVNAIFGSGNMTAGGGPWPGTPLTLTGAGNVTNCPVPLAVASTNAFTGGSSPTASAAHTTVGQTANTFAAFNGITISQPTTAPTVAGNGTGSSFGAGTYGVCYTWLTALGETPPSPATFVAATANQNLRVSAITAPAGATGGNFYVNGVYAGTANVSGGNLPQTDLTGASIAVGQDVPDVNTAYTVPNGTGSQIAVCALKYTTTSDASGRLTYGNVPTGQSFPNVSGFFGEQRADVPAYFRGTFDATKLVGLTSLAISQLGRLLIGTPSSPKVLRIT
jgi:hypothetical protein